jgi:hypothetical protein
MQALFITNNLVSRLSYVFFFFPNGNMSCVHPKHCSYATLHMCPFLQSSGTLHNCSNFFANTMICKCEKNQLMYYFQKSAHKIWCLFFIFSHSFPFEATDSTVSIKHIKPTTSNAQASLIYEYIDPIKI